MDAEETRLEGLTITCEEVEGLESGVLLRLHGCLDGYNMIGFQKEIQRVVASGHKKVILDAERLTYVGSAGDAMFPYCLRLTRQHKGGMVLLNVRPSIREIHELLGLSEFYTYANTLEEAVSLLSKPSPTKNEDRS